MSRRLVSRIDESASKAQEVRYELGVWSVPMPLTGSESRHVSVAAFNKRVEAGRARLSVIKTRVKNCVDKHRAEFAKISVTTNGYRTTVFGTRKETPDEVKKRLAKTERQNAAWDRSEQRRRRNVIQTMIKSNPDSVRDALRKYDREQMTEIVAQDPEGVRKTLGKKK